MENCSRLSRVYIFSMTELDAEVKAIFAMHFSLFSERQKAGGQKCVANHKKKISINDLKEQV